MTYLWDTTTFSALMRRDAKVRARVAALTPADRVVICTITRGEVLYGLARLPEGSAGGRWRLRQCPSLGSWCV